MRSALPAATRSAFTATLQRGARLLSWLAMALLATLVAAAPARASDLKDYFTPQDAFSGTIDLQQLFTIKGGETVTLKSNINKGSGQQNFTMSFNYSYSNGNSCGWNMNAPGGQSFISGGSKSSTKQDYTLAVFRDSQLTITIYCAVGSGPMTGQITSFDAPSNATKRPTLTSLDPATGVRAGGESIMLKGTGFTSDSEVYFGTYATNVAYIGEGQLAVTVPSAGDLKLPSSALPSKVAVKVKANGVYTDPQDFTYLPALGSVLSPGSPYSYTQGVQVIRFKPVTPDPGNPGVGTITYSISSNSGDLKTNTGLDFDSASGEIYGTPTTAAAATAYKITLTDLNSPTRQTSFQNVYIGVKAPVVALALTSLTPDTDTRLGGASVTVAGTGFTANSKVIVDGKEVPTTYVSATQSLTFTAPVAASAGKVQVKVKENGGETGAKEFTYTARPLDSVLSNGSTFFFTRDETIKRFTPVTLDPTKQGEGTITYSIDAALKTNTGLDFDTGTGEIYGTPTKGALATTYRVTLTDSNGTPQTSSKVFSIEVTAPVVALALTSLTPDTDTRLGGASVTVAGTGFTANSKVIVDGKEVTTTYVSATQSLTFTAPAAASAGKVQVKVKENGVETSAKEFTYTARPLDSVLSAGSPYSFTKDTLIKSFTPVTVDPIKQGEGTISYSITPNLKTNTGLDFNTGTGEISGTPSTVAAAQDYTVTLNDSNSPQQRKQSAAFSIEVKAPVVTQTITSLTPDNDTRLGGASVTVAGTGITANSKVIVDGKEVPTTYVSATQSLTFTAPVAASAGKVQVKVKENGVETGAKDFTYTARPLDSVLNAKSTYSFTNGALINDITPVTVDSIKQGEVGISYSIDPGFTSNTGLTFDTNSGKISGTPTKVSTETEYTVTLTDRNSPPQTSSQKFKLEVKAPAVTLALTSLTPDADTRLGGATITVAGTGFTANSKVIVDGKEVTTTYVNATQSLTFTAPPAASVGKVQVKVKENGVETGAKDFTYTPRPLDSVLNAKSTYSFTNGVLINDITPVTVDSIKQGEVGISYSIDAGFTSNTGLNFDTTNGKISGTPTKVSTVTEYTVTLTDRNSPQQKSSQKFSLEVKAATLSATLASPMPTLTVGQVVKGNFKPVTGSGGTLSYTYAKTKGSLPAGLSYAVDGVMSGTPTAAGEVTFSITVTDTDNTTYEQEVKITVNAATTSIRLEATPATPSVGQKVVLEATMGDLAASGQVTFKDGDTSLGSATLAGGKASFAISAITAGKHSFTAHYGGDKNYGAVSSSAVEITLNKRPDPTADKTVRAIAALQTATVQRVASTQIDQVNRRLEMLHEEDVPGFVNGISISPPRTSMPNPQAYEDPLKQEGLAAQNPAGRALGDTVKGADSKQDKASGNSFGILENSRFKVWTAGSVIFGGVNVSTQGVVTKTHFTLGSLTAGVDTKLLDTVKGGFAVSYSSDSNDIGTDGSKMNSRSLAGSLYASWKLTDRFFLDGNLGYGGVSFDSKRFDGNAGAFINGDRSGRMLFGSLALSYDVKDGPLTYAPYVRLDVIEASLGAYTETGDANWVLSYDKSTVGSKSAVLGLRGEYAMPQTWGVLSPTARFEYRRMLSGEVTQMMSYANDPGTTYSLTTIGADRDMFSGSLGLKARSDKDVTGEVEYMLSGAAKSGLQGQGLRGRLRVGF